MNKLPTVTVAVCAYNEAKNIGAFLNSVLGQEQRGFILERIVVISDGSTDKTVEECRKVSSPLIHLTVGKKRVGKSTYLNKIYKNLTSDFLVQSDADVVFDHPFVMHDMIEPFKKNQRVMMTGGNPLPMPPKTFFEKHLVHTLLPYFEMRAKLRDGVNPYTAIGQILAYRKSFLKQIYVPEDMIANDNFTYYSCLHLGHHYSFVPTGIARFRSSQRAKDHIRQNIRFSAVPARMKRYFPEEFINAEVAIPYRLFLPILIKHFILHPVSFLYLAIINMYCRYHARKREPFLTARWQMAFSTKRV